MMDGPGGSADTRDLIHKTEPVAWPSPN